MNKSFYLTTTLPYVNSKPHVGFALEIIQADTIARYHESLGEEIFFNTGTDEHGKKIYEKAIEEGKDPQAYTDEYAAKFDGLKQSLNLSYNHFIRTTNPHHKQAAQELWKRCLANGYIEKGVYTAKYCVGCELEKTDSDLVEGKCPLHPNKEIELIKEENYFFKFSDPRIQKALLAHMDKYSDFVLPVHRQKEIRNFVEGGLQDFSISRLKEKMPWGVPVPNDPDHVMYVWFDALTNYVSTIGWPEDEAEFAKYWGTKETPTAVQIAGKDNLRQQSSMWQAMLFAGDLPLTRQILIHGFITSGGVKMSKSLGNVIDPLEYSEKYGVDALRYYLLAKMNPFEDSDFTKEKFEEVYKSDLQNGLGNLVARVAAMAEKSGFSFPAIEVSLSESVDSALQNYKFDTALSAIWDVIKKADQFVSEKKVWTLSGDELQAALSQLVGDIRQIALDLLSFMPETAKKIAAQYNQEKITKAEPMFPRLT
ncbi:methionine--tRNA ligase [Candidatus Woesebacteria bacterium]|nr:methionine--tRNA ligase [Candidatus Woesebacteria bacterium]